MLNLTLSASTCDRFCHRMRRRLSAGDADDDDEREQQSWFAPIRHNPSTTEELRHEKFDYSSLYSPDLDGDSVGTFDGQEDYSSSENLVGRPWRQWKKGPYWNAVGRISLISLLLLMVADFVFYAVDAKTETFGTPIDIYDTLSAEVIRPAFLYRASSDDQQAEEGIFNSNESRTIRIESSDEGHFKHQPKVDFLLGSVVLFPRSGEFDQIEPTQDSPLGGNDHEAYWGEGWFSTLYSVSDHVRDAFSMDIPSLESLLYLPRGGGRRKPKSWDNVSKARKTIGSAPVKHELSLSASTPFVNTDDIAKMTLKDMTLAIRYTIERTQSDFNPDRLMKDAPRLMKMIFQRIDEVTAKSRGDKVLPSATHAASTSSGDIDVFYFCAAMRIFAEWRVLRLVPDGYKGYAVGMSLGQKDVVQNVAKIEQAAHNWIDTRIAEYADDASSDKKQVHAPTLRELLSFEVESGVHDKLPKLKEKSSGMGVLWVRRQLAYQTALFENVLQVPNKFDTTPEAVTAAYMTVYDQFHGWTVQKIFNYSFQAAPAAREIYKFMNPEKLKEVTEAAKTLEPPEEANHVEKNKKNSKPADRSDWEWEATAGFDHRGIGKQNAFEKLGRGIEREWTKIAAKILFPFSALQILNSDHGADPESSARNKAALSLAMIRENFITEEMEKDAYEHIRDHLEIAEPLLEDLASLFAELKYVTFEQLSFAVPI